jgi:PelA/Pel-15E family pectate lyase
MKYLYLVFIFTFLVVNALFTQSSGQLNWKSILKNSPDWFGSDEGITLAENIVKYQNTDGGWKKVMAGNDNSAWGGSTIDNNSTNSQIRVLAKVYNKTKNEKYKDSCLNGINCLLKNQYKNGGWPQIFKSSGYHLHITYNDDAMVNTIVLLDEIAKGNNPDFKIFENDKELIEKCKKAVDKAIECILKTQIVVNGVKTAWCQQHDETSLEPAFARAYELPSINSSESVNILKFLMKVENPGKEIKDAVNSGVEWLKKSQIDGIKVVSQKGDKIVVEDPDAKPIWARFYEMETNKPMFCGRDGEKKYNLADIEQERRTGYAWYGNWPENLIKNDYPQWLEKLDK